MRLVISVILMLLFLWGLAVPELGLYLMLICFGLFFLFILNIESFRKIGLKANFLAHLFA